jgi:hypothetical protein
MQRRVFKFAAFAQSGMTAPVVQAGDENLRAPGELLLGQLLDDGIGEARWQF